MKKLIIQKLVQRGQNHKDFCQDFLVEYEMKDFFLGVVMDGCSGGVHSHFASSLFGKIFNKIVRHDEVFNAIPEWVSPYEVIEYLMREFIVELQQVKAMLAMAPDELMSTALVAVYSKKSGSLCIVAFGDGFMRVDGEECWIVNDRFPDIIKDGKIVARKEDQPSYIAHDIDTINPRLLSSFETWLKTNPSYIFHDVSDFSISTDGIRTFRDRKQNDTSSAAVQILMDDRVLGGGPRNAAVLGKKMNILSNPESKNGYDSANLDDLSMIRVIVEEVLEKSVPVQETAEAQ